MKETRDMLLAVSRFKVVNGMEEEVARAFQGRPRWVDPSPGFLGMETFRDAADSAAFYLVTRWTDGPSFEAWHNSEAHHLSHSSIPKGLKLDPKFTRVMSLDRIRETSPLAIWEEAAKDASPLLAEFIRQSSLAHFFFCDLEGRIKQCNSAVMGQLKRDGASLIGGPLWPLLTDNDAQSLRRKLREPRNPGEKFLLNFVDAHHHPHTLECHLDVQPNGFVLVGEPGGDGGSTHEALLDLNNQFSVLNRENVRKQKEAEAARARAQAAESVLKESEERFRGTFNQAAVGMAHVSPEGQWLLVNDKLCEIVGYSREELLGKTFQEITHPEDIEKDLAHVRRVAEGAISTYCIEKRYIRKDGSTTWIDLTVSLVRHPSGEPRFFIAVVEDINVRKRLQEDLERHAEELLQRDRLKDEFLAMLAHELRNPLAPMLNAVHLMKLRGSEDPVLQRAQAIMERQLLRTKRLVDDLLDVSRITRGQIELKKEPVPLEAVVQAAVETCQPLIDSFYHELTVSLPDEPIRVDVDSLRFEQILVNLLNNAAKFTEPGGRIGLSAQRSGGEWVLRVRDNGKGIPPEMLPHIFDLFTQASPSADRAQGGLGLGLTLVDRLVRLHGGRIEARSEGPGRGSEFVLSLPVA